MISYSAIGAAVLLLSLIVFQVVLRALRRQLLERISELWKRLEATDHTEAADLWKQRFSELESQRAAAQLELEYDQELESLPLIVLMDSHACLARSCAFRCQEQTLRALEKALANLIKYKNDPPLYKEQQLKKLNQELDRALRRKRWLGKLIAS